MKHTEMARLPASDGYTWAQNHHFFFRLVLEPVAQNAQNFIDGVVIPLLQ